MRVAIVENETRAQHRIYILYRHDGRWFDHALAQFHVMTGRQSVLICLFWVFFAWLRVIFEHIRVVKCVDNCYHSILLPPYDVYT